MARKAVVLARGKGTRMQEKGGDGSLDDRARRMAERGLKGLIPVGGRPFLDYIVDTFLQAGVDHICLVVAPDCTPMERYARGATERSPAAVECAVQEQALGTADAVLSAEDFADGEPFLLSNSDNLCSVEALRRLAEADGCAVATFERDELARGGNISRDRVRAFAAVDCSEDDRLRAIVEKPDDPERYAVDGEVWVNMNLYRFTPEIFDACRRIEPNEERGELELTDAVALLLSEGHPFRVLRCRSGAVDLTRRTDIPGARRALQGREPSFPPPEE
ncbi:MAG: nucleotidyltransferase family protein [Planctomycetota bacterium]